MPQLFVPPMEGTSPLIERLRSHIARIAPTSFTVLIEGETGTGKELVARLIHTCSPRRSEPFVAVNCAALVESLLDAELFGIERGAATDVVTRAGRFEQAHQGTLFLDEVSDLSAAAQAKLLRVIQDSTVERVGGSPRVVNVRIVVATNKSLRALVQSGQFRSDLYYRLNAIELHVPPLRDRIDDVLSLATYFLKKSGARTTRLSTSVRDALIAYEWPGNVRELERAMERAAVFCDSDELRLPDLPAAIRTEAADCAKEPLQLDARASRYAQVVFEQCGRNKKLACRTLGISYHTLNRRLSGATAVSRLS